MKRDPVEERRARLAATRDAPGSSESLEILRRGLADKAQVVAARAAELVGELGLTVLVPDLIVSFDRFLATPGKDKGCLAKTAIMEALTRLEHDDPEVFLRGMGHVQREPVWGGTEDTAAWLRGLSGMGLAGSRHPEVVNRLVELLADPEKLARIGAVRALGSLGRAESAPLVRLKLLTGDPELEVMAEGFHALLALEPPRDACAFVGRFLLDGEPAVAEAAALSLGESRIEAAFEVLKDVRDKVMDRSLQRVILVAMALLRSETAIGYLVERIASDSTDSRGALEALGPFLYSAEIRNRVERAVEEAESPTLKSLYEELLADSSRLERG